MKLPFLLILLTLLLALPALWLLLRRHSAGSSLAALALLLAATATGYTAIRLWLQPPSTSAAADFVSTAAAGHFQTITPAQLPAALAHSRGRPVLLEFYADWCPSCVVWKEQVFNRSDVQAAMQPLVLLQVDATDMPPDVQALLEQYQLAGLPALLVFDRQGQERPELRLLGEMTAPDFIRWLRERLLPSV